MTEQFDVKWIDREREPQCPPDPDYPDGINLDVSNGSAFTCKAILPYPAKRCGIYTVDCRICGARIACTTAGRVDDPRSITFPCQIAAREANVN